MRTDRLYALTLYLLNHGKTTAAQLSRQFEVSKRTIQRDMDMLCQAGIPVIAQTGANGGYYLAASFRMRAQLAAGDDFSFILTALKRLSGARKHAKTAQPKHVRVTLRCSGEAKQKAMERLDGIIIREHENGDCDIALNVSENEHMWFGMVLSLGDGVEILSPKRIRLRVIRTAERIVELYSS